MRRLLVVPATAALVLALAPPASAHENRSVGQMQVVVGWESEPAYAGFLNGVSVRLTRDAEPVTRARLRVEVAFGDEKMDSMALEPAFGDDGHYHAAIVPTRAGEYSFHVTGRAGGRAFDQTFTSGERTFDSVSDPDDIEFPVRDPSNGELGDRVQRLDPRLDEVRRVAVAEADDAGSSATLALIVGALGVLLGLVALVLAARKPSTDGRA